MGGAEVYGGRGAGAWTCLVIKIPLAENVFAVEIVQPINRTGQGCLCVCGVWVVIVGLGSRLEWYTEDLRAGEQLDR